MTADDDGSDAQLAMLAAGPIPPGPRPPRRPVRPAAARPRRGFPAAGQAAMTEAVLGALLWSEVAGRAAVHARDICAAAAQAGPAADGVRALLGQAASDLLTGSWDDADRRLRQAVRAAREAGGPAGVMICLFRARLNEVTAADSAGTPIRRFDRVTFAGAAGVVESVTSGSGDRRAEIYPPGSHLAPAARRFIPHRELTVTARGADPVTAAEAQAHASHLPAGVTLAAASRAELARAIRAGRAGSAQ